MNQDQIRIDNNVWLKACPLCGSCKIKAIGKLPQNKFVPFSSHKITLLLRPELWNCCQCRSAFTQNKIDQDTSLNLYSSGFSDDRWAARSFAQSKNPEIVDEVLKVIRSSASVLDIGCNTGELLDYAKINYSKTYGVEPSKKSRKLLSKKGHIAYESITQCNQLYDAIFAFDVVEHLHDLPQFLDWARVTLAQTGKLVILTGDIMALSAKISKAHWWYASYPEHIVFPSKKYFRNLAGFKLEKIVRTYASIGYCKPIASAIIAFLKSLLTGKPYNGLPSLGPDHILIVLSKVH